MLKVRSLKNTYQDPHKDLVEACKKGESKAQYRLYQLYSKSMFNICMRITNHQAEAEDVLQDAFVDAFRKINSFKGNSTFGAWLKRIVINKAINQIKKRKLEFVSVEKMDFESEEEEDNTPPKWQVEKVHQGIQYLSDGFRTVLTLYLLEGYDHKEIAEILGISESTSKSQYNRAKKKLLHIVKDL